VNWPIALNLLHFISDLSASYASCCTPGFYEIQPRAQGLVNKFEFVGSFGINLYADFHELEVTPKLEFSFAFGMSWEVICHEFDLEY
jgi:hypothetical protein